MHLVEHNRAVRSCTRAACVHRMDCVWYAFDGVASVMAINDKGPGL